MKKLQLEELKRDDLKTYKRKKKLPVVLVLDNIRSLNNVGSAFRTGDAFSIDKIFLCGITGAPPHKDINKTALGAQMSVDWEHHSSTAACIKLLKEQGFKIAIVEQIDKSIYLQNMTFVSSEKYALVLGNEVTGISDDVLPLADFAIEIPQFGTKHSLNVSVSIGVVLWDYMSKIGISNL